MGSDYEVGKGKPPKHTRWVKGVSGNPKGRPKGARNLKNIVRDELNKKVLIRENGVALYVTAGEAGVKRSVEIALKGNIKVLDWLFEKYGDPDRDDGPKILSKSDHDLLAQFAEEQISKNAASKTRKGKAKVDNRKRRSRRTS